MSVLNGRGRGDLVARILVETPTRMSSKQKKILEEFRETETGDECPASKRLFQPRPRHVRRLVGGSLQLDRDDCANSSVAACSSSDGVRTIWLSQRTRPDLAALAG